MTLTVIQAARRHYLSFERVMHEMDVNDPCQRLLLAILVRALRDVLSGRPEEAAEARDYLSGPNFRVDCEWLGINPDRILARLEATHAATQPRLDPAAYRAAHNYYISHPTRPSLRVVARRYGTSASVLARAFRRLELPARDPREQITS